MITDDGRVADRGATEATLGFPAARLPVRARYTKGRGLLDHDLGERCTLRHQIE